MLSMCKGTDSLRPRGWSPYNANIGILSRRVLKISSLPPLEGQKYNYEGRKASSRLSSVGQGKRQTGIILGDGGTRRLRAADVVDFRHLKLAPHFLVTQAVHEHGEPPRKSSGLPDPAQGDCRVLIQERVAPRTIVFDQTAEQNAHIGSCQVQTFRAGRRHDMRRVADQK